MSDGPRKPKNGLSLARLFSWLAGLSLGSVIFGILLALVILAFFVRTEFFQTQLRDQVVTLVQERLSTQITYETATVEIFRLYPRINFKNVQIKDRSTGVEASIERISVSISAIVSIPLLLFRKIYLSSAEIEGLSYHLTDTKILSDWMERVNPSQTTVGIPSAFSATIREIIFSDFELSVDLEAGDTFAKPLAGSFQLDVFRVVLDGDYTYFEGEFPFKSLRYGGRQIPDGRIRVQEGRLSNDTVVFDRLVLASNDDELDISGSIRGFQNPHFNVKGTLTSRFENLFLGSDISGGLEASFRYQGEWLKGKGTVEGQVSDFRYQRSAIDNIKFALRLNKNIAEIVSADLTAGNDQVSLSGKLGLSARDVSELSIHYKNVNISRFLAMIEDHFNYWRGQITGKASIKGSLWTGNAEVVFDSKVDGFAIYNVNQSLRYAAPLSDLRVRLSMKSWSTAEGQIALTTQYSDWTSTIKWNDSEFWIDWLGKINGPIGRLFYFDLQAVGEIQGFYGGPFETMDLKIVPRLKQFALDQWVLNNLRGQIDLDEKRQFVANPLLADRLRVEGGLYFPKVGETRFYNLDFQVEGVETLRIFNSLPQTRDWKLKPRGVARAEGVLQGPIGDPVGEGSFEVKDVRFDEDPTLGRLIKTKFRFAEGYWELFESSLRLSEEGGQLQARATISTEGIVEGEAKGRAVRLSDWLHLLKVDMPIQSLVDLDLRYGRKQRELVASAKLYDTSVGVTPQKPSTIQLKFGSNAADINFDFFEGAFVGSANSATSNQIRSDLRIEGLNIAPFLGPLERSGMEWLLSGSGDCQFEFTPSRGNSGWLGKMFEAYSRSTCSLKMGSSRIRRGNVQLHSVSSFFLSVRHSPTAGLRVGSEKVIFRTDEDRLNLSGYFRNSEDLELRIDGQTKLESVSYLVEPISRSDGRLSVNGRWNPAGFSGRIRLENGLITLSESPLILREVSALVIAQNSQFEISSLNGQLREGDISATGQFALDAFSLTSASITTQLNGTLIEPMEGLRFRTSGPVHISFNLRTGGFISGQLSLLEGRFRRRINLRSDLAKAFQPKKREYEFFEKKESFFDPWKLDLRLQTGEAFQVRNNLAEGEFEASLQLGGVVAEPRLSGSLAILRGRFNYFNKSFEIKTGSAQFNNPESNIPRYDIQAETEIGEYRVFINVVGDANEQRVQYSSDPPLTEKQILALVSAGAPPSEGDRDLDEDPTISAAYTGISLVTGQLQDTIEGALASEFGIQRFQLYPTFYEGTGRTELQLKVGTDLVRNRLALNYSNFISADGGHLLELDFRVNRNISLVGSWRDTPDEQRQNISGDLGGDIIFRFEIE